MIEMQQEGEERFPEIKNKKRRNRLLKAEIFLEGKDPKDPRLVWMYMQFSGVNAETAKRDLRVLGVPLPVEVSLNKNREKKRLRQKRIARKRARKEAGLSCAAETKYRLSCDERFCYIYDHEKNGAPRGISWEEVGIDPGLPLAEKILRFQKQNAEKGESLYETYQERAYWKAMQEARESGRKKKGNRKRQWEDEEDDDIWCDDTFSYIAGFTSGGAPYGTTWEEQGIDPDLSLEEKKKRLEEKESAESGPYRELTEEEWEERPFH